MAESPWKASYEWMRVQRDEAWESYDALGSRFDEVEASRRAAEARVEAAERAREEAVEEATALHSQVTDLSHSLLEAEARGDALSEALRVEHRCVLTLLQGGEAVCLDCGAYYIYHSTLSEHELQECREESVALSTEAALQRPTPQPETDIDHDVRLRVAALACPPQPTTCLSCGNRSVVAYGGGFKCRDCGWPFERGSGPGPYDAPTNP